jgi:hypothetical protein
LSGIAFHPVCGRRRASRQRRQSGWRRGDGLRWLGARRRAGRDQRRACRRYSRRSRVPRRGRVRCRRCRHPRRCGRRRRRRFRRLGRLDHGHGFLTFAPQHLIAEIAADAEDYE